MGIGSLSPVAAELPASLDGHSMAMEYRVDNGDMFTNLKIDVITFKYVSDSAKGNPLYRLDGMLGWYNNLYLLEAPLAEYDAAAGLLYIHPGQSVIDRDEMTWQIYNMVDDYDMNAMPVILRADNDGIFRHVSSGKIDGESISSTGMVIGTYSEEVDEDTGEPYVYMLYMLQSPVIHPYNGSMDYKFVAQNGKEFSQKSVIYTYVDGLNLIFHNWSDSGFEYKMFFTIDAAARTVTATNQACLYDPDMLGECVLGAATEEGAPIYNDEGGHTLQGTFTTETIDGKEQTVIHFPVWGCFNDRGTNFFVPTTDTVVYPGYDILNAASVTSPTITVAADGDTEYYTPEGIRVTTPSTGMYIVRQGGKVSKVLVK